MLLLIQLGMNVSPSHLTIQIFFSFKLSFPFFPLVVGRIGKLISKNQLKKDIENSKSIDQKRYECRFGPSFSIRT